jgi:hypothetical protein
MKCVDETIYIKKKMSTSKDMLEKKTYEIIENILTVIGRIIYSYMKEKKEKK